MEKREVVIESKPWYKSKTIITNLVALFATIGLNIQAEEVVAILAVTNLILRLITDKGIKLWGR